LGIGQQGLEHLGDTTPRLRGAHVPDHTVPEGTASALGSAFQSTEPRLREYGGQTAQVSGGDLDFVHERSLHP